MAYFGYVFLAGKLTRVERNRVIVILVLVLACAMFWAGFEQAGSSLNLFAERFTLRDLAGFEIPASWFQSLNPTFIILLAPVYAMFWVWLARRHLEPAAPAKFAFGLIILGLGFAVMIGAAAARREGTAGLADLARVHVSASHDGGARVEPRRAQSDDESWPRTSCRRPDNGDVVHVHGARQRDRGPRRRHVRRRSHSRIGHGNTLRSCLSETMGSGITRCSLVFAKPLRRL